MKIRFRNFTQLIIMFVILAISQGTASYTKTEAATSSPPWPNILFASGDNYLYTIDLDLQEVEIVDPFTITPIKDIAFDGDQLYGVTGTNLVAIDWFDATCTNIGSIGYSGVNALAVGPDGTMYAATEAGDFLRINKSTGVGTYIGYYGQNLHSAGDLAFRNDGKLFASINATGYTLSTLFYEIDPNTGVASSGSDLVPFYSVNGISNLNGVLYGVTSNSDVIEIDSNGHASLVFKDTFYDAIFTGLTTSPPSSAEPPIVNWVYPVGNQETYTASGGVVDLEVTVSSATTIDRVEFSRWDAVDQVEVLLGIHDTAPYQSDVSISELNMGWNEIDARAYNTSGVMGYDFIWIYRTAPQLPTVSFSDATYSVNEKDGSAVIYMELSSESSNTVTVQFATSNGTATAGSDYTAVSKTVTFQPGDVRIGAVISIINDTADEANETVNLDLASPTGATLGSPNHAVLTIVDDDATITYSISGYVQTSTGSGISGVLVTDGHGHSRTTGSNGFYEFTGLPAGTYTVTPSKSGYTFDPPGTAVVVPDSKTGITFVGTQVPGSYTISGYVLVRGLNIGVSNVRISDGQGHIAYTNADGYYQIAELTSGNYNLAAAKDRYTFDPPGNYVAVPPNQSDVNFTVKTIELAYIPNPDGYKFDNENWYGWYYGYKAEDAFTINDLGNLYGFNSVCTKASGLYCEPTTAAEAWYKDLLKGLTDGQCLGFSITDARFYSGYNGDQPQQLDSDAQTVWGLGFDNSLVRKHIAYFDLLWNTPASAENINAAINQKISDVLKSLYESFTTDPPQDPFIMYIAMDYSSAHAMVPYALEDQNGGTWWIKVYDPNDPGGDTNHVIVNELNNTWEYRMNTTGRPLWKNGDTKSRLFINRVSHFPEKQLDKCPFCLGTNAPDKSQVSLNSVGGKNILITDYESGNSIGYVDGQFISEIQDAFAIPDIGSALVPSEPTYYLPVGRSYGIYLNGTPSTQVQDVSLRQFGPGYAVGVDRMLKPTTHDETHIFDDGSALTYWVNESSTANFLLTDDTDQSVSYGFEVAGVTLAPGIQGFFMADRRGANLRLENNTTGTYDLIIRRVTADHGEQVFIHHGIPLPAGASHRIIYPEWDGVHDMHIAVDYDNDGNTDEELYVSNELPHVYLPLVIK